MSLAVPVLAALAVFAATALGLKALIPWLIRRKVVDVPNARSSHTTVTPRGGGLAPVAALAAAGFASTFWLGALWPAIFATLAATLSLLSFADDRRSLGVGTRFAAQGLAVAAAWLLVMREWPPPLGGAIPWPVLAPLLWIGWLWFINLYNFMDGIDGISGVETATIGLGAALVALAAGPGPLQAGVVAAGLVFAAAGLGFLTANWHPARVFMGDAGSIPLGFLGGALLIALAAAGHAAAALVLPAYYVVDATLTLLIRLSRREKVWQPHRTHAYQRALTRGLSHADVCLRLIGLNAALMALALVSLAAPWIALTLAYAATLAFWFWLPRGAA